MKLSTIIFSRQTLVILIAGLLSLGAIYYTLVSSAADRRDAADELLASRQAVVQELEVKLAQAQAGTSDVERHLQLVQKVDALLPPDMSQLEAGQGLDSSAFLFVYRTLPTLPQRFGLDGDPAALSDLTAGPAGLEYLAATYSFTGTSAQVAQFVDAIHDYPILATIEDMSLQRAADTAVDSWTVNATVHVWFSTLAPLPDYVDPGYDESMLGGVTPPPVDTAIGDSTGTDETADTTVPSTPDTTIPSTPDTTAPSTPDTTSPTTDTTVDSGDETTDTTVPADA